MAIAGQGQEIRQSQPGEEPPLPASPGLSAPVQVALYLTAWEVTREIILHPAMLNGELALGWQDGQAVTPAMRTAALQEIAVALERPCDLIIDSELAAFESRGIQFIAPDVDNFSPLGEADSVTMEDFRIVVRDVTPLPALDSALMLRWDYFPGQLQQVPLRIADTLGSRERLLTPATGYFQLPYKLASNLREPPQPPPAPVLREHSYPWLYPSIAAVLAFCLFRKRWGAAVATLAVGLVSYGTVTWRNHTLEDAALAVAESEGQLIAERILEGVYHGYNFRDENLQYDVLAQVLAEPALTTVFLETNRTVESREREGSQVQVQAVTVLSAETTSLGQRPGLAVDCQWRTRGQVGHWGHFHDRSNLFTARLEIEVRDDRWKATALSLRNRIRE